MVLVFGPLSSVPEPDLWGDEERTLGWIAFLPNTAKLALKLQKAAVFKFYTAFLWKDSKKKYTDSSVSHSTALAVFLPEARGQCCERQFG